jgi:hypothetical protein
MTSPTQGGSVLLRLVVPFGILVTLIAATVVGETARSSGSPNVLRVTSGTPGHEVRFRGVLLVLGQPMRLVEQTTPFEYRSDRELVLGAFEPTDSAAMLRLELVSQTPMPAVVTAPRVIVGQRLGGVATEFVQGY